MPDTELLPKSNAESVRRLEVFTGSGRRRAWPAEQKAQILAEISASGESVSAVARRYGLTPQQVFGWRRNARQAGQDGSSDSRAAFARVMVETARPSAIMPIPPVIEVVIGTATVRISPRVDAATLQTVLRALRAVT